MRCWARGTMETSASRRHERDTEPPKHTNTHTQKDSSLYIIFFPSAAHRWHWCLRNDTVRGRPPIRDERITTIRGNAIPTRFLSIGSTVGRPPALLPREKWGNKKEEHLEERIQRHHSRDEIAFKMRNRGEKWKIKSMTKKKRDECRWFHGPCGRRGATWQETLVKTQWNVFIYEHKFKKKYIKKTCKTLLFSQRVASSQYWNIMDSQFRSMSKLRMQPFHFIE